MTFSIFSCFLHPTRLGKFLTRSVGRHPDSIVSVSVTATLPFGLTCLWQVKDGMNMGKRCLQSRPRGPSAKRQPSPEGLGIQRQPVERRRCGTTLFVCSLREPVTFSIFSCFLHPIRLGKFLPRSVGRHPDSIVSVSPTATLPFVIPSVAEGSAGLSSVTNAAVLKMNCRPACPGVPWTEVSGQEFWGSFGYR